MTEGRSPGRQGQRKLERDAAGEGDVQRIDRSISFRLTTRPPTRFAAFDGSASRSSLNWSACAMICRSSLRV
jgi:hypothetical protein